MSDHDILFSPITLNTVTFHNRWVMPAMQRGMCSNGAPSAELAAYYRRRAEGGTALIVGESAAIDHPSATVQPTSAHINPATRDAWAHCVDEVRQGGGQMMLQLWHEGAMRTDGHALSASGLAHPGKESGRAATVDELAQIRDGFVRSARIAQDIGACGVEVHAAHGYFLDQFLWHGSNIRDDGYGGPLIAHRARFPAEIVSAIRAECGPDFLISLRFSQWKEVDFEARVAPSPEDLAQMATIFRKAGVDVLHASTRRFWDAEWAGDGRNLAGWTRAGGGLPVITVGSVGLDIDVMTVFMEGLDPGPRVEVAIDELARRMSAGEFDMVAVGRALIGDPDFVNKVQARDYDAIRTFRRDDLGQLEWDLSIVEEAHGA
ncbi:NADH:flavin oxidoreductase [Alteraurantiacibacter aestuarii]|uniref:12-oxophytodienoate reductase n=1 Tax=Alteraurantiacibacter aestuarii TaxID=650004 RepID=A0A844ZU31_9SPHN|nr:12-oxophytodienoate reductase [Alteraurantiacibacter aestuarii]MXO89069.1 12-oxophytodienoate reductase [Alteraurantiacibacter aestuarii]